MPSYNKSIIVPLDEALKEIHNLLDVYKSQNDMNAYNFLIYGFLAPKTNSAKIDNLESFKYTIVCKKNVHQLSLSIYNKPGITTTNLTTTQINELKRLNDYLKQPGMLKSIKKYQMKAVIPFSIIVISILILIFLAKNKML
ncbi:MAG: hypothetical protein ACRDCW_00130 [Sarcina sp.]